MSRPSPFAGVTIYVERWGELLRAYPERPETLVPMCALCRRLADRIIIEHRPHGAARMVVFCHGAQEEVLVPPRVLVPGTRFTLMPAFRQLPVRVARPRAALLGGTVVDTTVGHAPNPGQWGPSPLRGLLLMHGLLSPREFRDHYLYDWGSQLQCRPSEEP